MPNLAAKRRSDKQGLNASKAFVLPSLSIELRNVAMKSR
jgi:hypothetical protein